MRDKIKISLILPCYNEEINLQKGVLDKVKNFVDENDFVKEVIIVDDGSTDSTAKIIKQEYLPKFRKLVYKKIPHQGKAGAVIAGILSAKQPFIAFSDIDMATPIEELHKLKKYLEQGYDIVIGSRNTERKGAPLIRKIMARGFILIRNILLNLGSIKDTQCGFKAFSRKAAREIIDKMQVFSPKKIKETKGASVSAGFDLEFLFVGKKLGFKIKEIPVKWRHVETRNVSVIKDSLESLRDIFKIKINALLNKY